MQYVLINYFWHVFNREEEEEEAGITGPDGQPVDTKGEPKEANKEGVAGGKGKEVSKFEI